MNFIETKNIFNKKPNFTLQLLGNVVFVTLVVLSLFFLGFSMLYVSTPVVGESMQPTLNPKGEFKSDIVYVNKLSGFSRQDIIVIHQTESEDAEYIIKRVIGIAGDRINIIYNADDDSYELWVNDEKWDEPYLYDWENLNEPNNFGMQTTYNNFNGLKTTKPELFNESEELVVPQNEVFVLGDNRGKSLDSSQKGPFSVSLVVGKVDFIVPYGQSEWIYFLNIFTPFHFNEG